MFQETTEILLTRLAFRVKGWFVLTLQKRVLAEPQNKMCSEVRH